jgi:hypothetical protein
MLVDSEEDMMEKLEARRQEAIGPEEQQQVTQDDEDVILIGLQWL